MSGPASWAPMVEPPLLVKFDPLLDTCAHGYPAEECHGHAAPECHLSS